MSESGEESWRRLAADFLLEAANPTTSPERLRDLYESTGENAPWTQSLSDAILANPNVPPDLLWNPPPSRYGRAEYPLHCSVDAFLSNPVVPLLLLEMPEMPYRLRHDDLLRLLARAAL